jgi:hypothetical protein
MIAADRDKALQPVRQTIEHLMQESTAVDTYNADVLIDGEAIALIGNNFSELIKAFNELVAKS